MILRIVVKVAYHPSLIVNLVNQSLQKAVTKIIALAPVRIAMIAMMKKKKRVSMSTMKSY